MQDNFIKELESDNELDDNSPSTPDENEKMFDWYK